MAIDQKMLQDYLEGLLSEEDSARVQLYLAEHWNDPGVVALMDSHFDSCRVEATSHDRKMLGVVLDRISGEQAAMRRRTRRWITAAAIAALILAIPAAMQFGYRMHKDPAPVAWQEVSVPKTETMTLDLSDGTHLVLNSGSRVTWPDRFTGDTRDIFMEGEVLAQVSKDPAHPFVIHAGDVSVRVHGTTFEFKSYQEESQVRLMLMEGSVSLDVPSSEGNREVIMSPGDMAIYNREDGDVSLTRMSTESFRPFTEGRSFEFYNTPLSDIAAELERSFGKRIVIGDSRISGKRFLAFFTNGESLDEIIDLLAKNGKLRVSRSNDSIYLYSK